MSIKFVTTSDISNISKYDRAFLLGYYASSRRISIYKAYEISEQDFSFFENLSNEYLRYLVGENIKIENIEESDYKKIDSANFDTFHIPSYIIIKPHDSWKSLAIKLNNNEKNKINNEIENTIE